MPNEQLAATIGVVVLVLAVGCGPVAVSEVPTLAGDEPSEAGQLPEPDLSGPVAELGLEGEWGDGWAVTSDHSAVDETIRSVTAERAGQTLRIRSHAGLEGPEIDALIDEQALLLTSLFAERDVSYPGHISTTIGCSEDFLPRLVSPHPGSPIRRLYALPASVRLEFGVCSDDLATHRAAVALMACHLPSRVVRVEAFVPRGHATSEPLDLVASVRCEGELPGVLWGVPVEPGPRVAGVETAYHDSDDVVLEVRAARDLGAAAARRLADERWLVFESLFEVRRTGYPGHQTTFLECPERFRPVRKQRDADHGGFVDAWMAWAGANRVAGACAADLAVHRAVWAHLYCPDQGLLLQVSWSVPGDERAEDRAAAFVERLGCDGL